MTSNHTNPSNYASNVIVLGATSLVGNFLLPLLAKNGFNVLALSRKSPPLTSQHKWHKLQNENDSFTILPPLPQANTLISLAPLWTLPPLLTQFTGNRLIAFSSTSIFTKINSPSTYERQIIQQLVAAETNIAQICQDNAIAWTILRPTLTYGLGLDKSITVIANFIKRFGFFPIFGKGSGLRQPVHASDLAAACFSIIDIATTFDKAYNLPGGETLSYYEMVNVIFQSQQKNPRTIVLPLSLLRLAVSLITLLPRYKHIHITMFERMNKDLCFDFSKASKDFGYTPKKFSTSKELLGLTAYNSTQDVQTTFDDIV